MSELSRVLDLVISEHDRIGSPARRFLRPGVAEGEIRSRLAALGIEASQEVIDYFGWADGVDQRAWLRENPDAPALAAFWPAQWIDLPSAIILLEQQRALSPFLDEAPNELTTGYWVRGWLPFLFSSPELYVAASSASSVRSPVWRTSDIPDDTFPTMRVADSLVDYWERVLDLLRADAYRWDSEVKALLTVDEVFEERGLVSYRP